MMQTTEGHELISYEDENYMQSTKKSSGLTALDILKIAANTIAERGKQRDNEDGERSMARTVKIFNACTDLNLTESDGWLFMECLKKARSLQGSLNIDDYIDGAAYAALRGECQINNAVSE